MGDSGRSPAAPERTTPPAMTSSSPTDTRGEGDRRAAGPHGVRRPGLARHQPGQDRADARRRPATPTRRAPARTTEPPGVPDLGSMGAGAANASVAHPVGAGLGAASPASAGPTAGPGQVRRPEHRAPGLRARPAPTSGRDRRRGRRGPDEPRCHGHPVLRRQLERAGPARRGRRGDLRGAARGDGDPDARSASCPVDGPQARPQPAHRRLTAARCRRGSVAAEVVAMGGTTTTRRWVATARTWPSQHLQADGL